MKKNLLTFCNALAFGIMAAQAQPVITNLNFAAQHADVSIADMDGDGDLDVLISGEDGGNKVIQMFTNNAGALTAATPPFPAVSRSAFDWNDVNNDGKPDILITGVPAGDEAYAKVFTGNGSGTFTQSSLSLIALRPSSGMADLNNDGYTDIYIFGNRWQGKPKIYFNNKAGGFNEVSPFDDYDFIDTDVTTVDFDNDGDLDLFVNAASDDKVMTRFTKMFVNTNGSFAPLTLTGIIPKGYGSAAWGDYDGDGYLDLLLMGDGWHGTTENSNDIVRLYHNDAGSGTFTPVTTFSEYRQGSTGDGCRFADWDNDGDLDVIIGGWNNNQGRQATAIFLNNAGAFTPYSFNNNLPGASENSMEVGDIDGDGDLDLIISGFSGNNFNGAGSAYNSNASVLITNPATTVNTRPTLPTGLTVTGSQSAITFSWAAGSDATTPQAALSYNLFLVDGNGKWLYFPMADTATGRLGLQRMGNVQLNKTWTVKDLAPGVYRWGIQAIDNSFAASDFAKASFTINASGVLPIVLKTFSVTASGSYSLVSWSTSTEQNNHRFEVERSADGIHFTTLAVLPALNSIGTNHYSITDKTPMAGMNYYRLVQYDRDGTRTVSTIRTLNFQAQETFSTVYPNPSRGTIRMKLHYYRGNTIQAVITDVSGRVISRSTIATTPLQNDYRVEVPAKLSAGTYFLQLHGGNYMQSLRVNIQR